MPGLHLTLPVTHPDDQNGPPAVSLFMIFHLSRPPCGADSKFSWIFLEKSPDFNHLHPHSLVSNRNRSWHAVKDPAFHTFFLGEWYKEWQRERELLNRSFSLHERRRLAYFLRFESDDSFANPYL